MYFNIISSEELEDIGNWTVQSFVKVKPLQTTNSVKLCKLGDFFKERRENYNPAKETQAHVFIGLENIESDIGLISDQAMPETVSPKATAKKYHAGDILYGRLRPSLNKVLYVDESLPEGICSNEIIVLEKTRDDVNPRYVAGVLRTKAMNFRIVNLVRGASLPRVAATDLLEIEIPIPSLEEQNQLAEIIELEQKRFSDCAALLRTIPNDLNIKVEHKLFVS